MKNYVVLCTSRLSDLRPGTDYGYINSYNRSTIYHKTFESACEAAIYLRNKDPEHTFEVLGTVAKAEPKVKQIDGVKLL